MNWFLGGVMHGRGRKIKIFSGNSNILLAERIAKELGIPVGDAKVSTFSDGEITVNINETVRGADVFVVQSVSPPKVNDYLMELLIIIDALKRASAGRIIAVIPYYGYARQDRKVKARDPISSKLVANLLTNAGADRILTMDLHAAQIQGYFDIPVDHLIGGPILAKHISKMQLPDLTVVAPDLGSVTRSRDFAQLLDAPIAIIDKRRPMPNVSEVMNIIGDIKDRNVVLLDDIIDTAGTITNAASALKERGAKSVYACCTHGVFSGPAFERIEKSEIDELIVLDTIDIPKEKKLDKMHVISVAPVFGESIRRIFNNDSVSKIFI